MRTRSIQAQQQMFTWVVLTPILLLFAVFWIYPLIDGVWGSLTHWQGFADQRPFAGLHNYTTLWQDPIFRRALLNTLLYSALYAPLSIALALLLALAIEATYGRWRTFFRTAYFLPVITSVTATALIWAWLYQPAFGLFNQLLQLVGLPTQRFLISPSQALVSIVVYAIWKNLGFNLVLFMAGLKAIDRTFHEAARVDGANDRQIFWRITLPLLRPTMIFVIITSVIDSLQTFGPIFVMTSREANDAPGGPLNATLVLSIYQWQAAFRELNLGYGAAMGIVLFLIILALTLTQAGSLRNRWEY